MYITSFTYFLYHNGKIFFQRTSSKCSSELGVVIMV